MEEIRNTLFEKQDLKYRDFQLSLIPTMNPEKMIGVRTPMLRAMAKQMIKDGQAEKFLAELPHEYFEENQLHAFILSEMKDYNKVIGEVHRFLPYVDNWATCDQLRPKSFKKHTGELISDIKEWMVDEKTYTIRFAIGMLMCHYLDAEYKPEYLEMVNAVKSDEYYVNMMIAWYLATALAKQYDDTIQILENGSQSVWVHNKTIQKARESFRVSEEQKEYLKSLRRKS